MYGNRDSYRMLLYTTSPLYTKLHFTWKEKMTTNRTIRRNSRTDSAPRCFPLQFPP